MQRSSILLLVAILVIFAVSSVRAADRSELWAEVEKAVNNGLPQTAIEKLSPIIDGALADGKMAEAARAICKRIVLESNIQGNKAEEKIVRLEKELQSIDQSIKPLLQVILARWYWHYFQQNNWRFLNRTRTEGLNEKDFTTWDLPKLFDKIAELYESALENEDQLKAIPISEIDDILERGNVPAELRPTLFDFYAHQALEFYTSGEQAGAAPQDAFEIDANSPVFDDAATFAKWNVTTTDTKSPKYRALKLYQRLIKFHLERADISALIDVDLQRLNWANNAASPNGRSDRYIKRLKALAEEYSSNSLSSLALAMCAEELLKRGDNKAAWETANEGRNRFPDSDGGIMCTNIITRIEAKQLTIVTERVSGAPTAQARISWRNIDEANFRLVDISDWELFVKDRYNPESLEWEVVKKAVNLKPASSWKVSLEPTPDFKLKQKTVFLPQMKAGRYLLLASWKPDFSENDNTIQYTTVWYTKMALIVRNRNGTCEGLLLNNETGKPIEGGNIEAVTYDYNTRGWKHYKYGKVKTDANGIFRFEMMLTEAVIVAESEGEKLISQDRISVYGHSKPSPYERVFFFTDRGLYRPGQTIQFKAICVLVDTEANHYEVIPNRSFNVSFRDANGEEISKIDLTTNDFGSCQGTFTAPTGRLTGTMSLIGVGISGSTAVQVEEYKRPKFKVTLEPPQEGMKLGEEVVVNGVAQSYTTAPIDGASIKFRVTRKAIVPDWCWWCRIPAGDDQEIAHGVLQTDVNGKFIIKFKAKPDSSIPPENQPVFTYRITADVTDTAGETRSHSISIRIGYTALELGITTPSWIEAEKDFNIGILSHTLDGKGIPAGGKLKISALAAPEKMPRKPIFPPAEGELDLSDIATWKEGNTVLERNFNTSVDGSGELPVKLPAGAYRVFIKSQDRFNKEVTAQKDVVVLDTKASSWKVKEPSRLTIQNSSPKVGDTFRAIWGTGYESGRAYIELEQSHEILQAFWTPENKTQYLIELPITEKLRGGFTLRVTYVRENRVYFHQTPISVPWTNKDLELSFAHFSSKLQPGQEESWTITVKGPEAQAKAIELAATLYDASLDAFLPFSWMRSFDFFANNATTIWQLESNERKQLISLLTDWDEPMSGVYRRYPQFKDDIITNFFGYGMRGLRIKGRSFADEGSIGMLDGTVPEEKIAPSIAMAPPPAPSMRKALKADMAQQAMLSEKAPLQSSAEPETGAARAQPAVEQPNLNLDKISARANLNETAFFMPQLLINERNEVVLQFKMPEALTTWKFLAFAHGKACQSGGLTAETVTQKDLMVQPNPPRFLREGDTLEFTAKVTNMTDRQLDGRIKIKISDPAKDEDRTSSFGITNPETSFSVPAKESRTVAWKLTVPDGTGIIAYKVVAAAQNFSDGEENLLPILPRRIFVQEALPLPIRGPASKTFKFQKLLDSAQSSTLRHESLTLQMTSNPAWYAVQALPYLMEFPHECSEQMFNRLYANSLARFIAMSNPKIKRVFETWKTDEARGGQALKSNLEKNEALKNIVLLETPWVREAKSETEAKHRIGILFDENRINNEISIVMNKLSQMQYNDGAWPWFPGGRPDSFITLYIATGYGRLRHLGVDIDISPANRAWSHLDSWVDEMYREIVRHGRQNDNNLSPLIAFYLYGRSFFLKEIPIPASSEEAVEYFKKQAVKYWLDLNFRLSQGHLAIALNRFGDTLTAKKIMASIKERSVTDEELGRFWRDTELSFSWNRAPIETQALMIEAFDEVTKDKQAVEECKVWLLKQKQTQDWKTTKATADAVYALLLKGTDLLASDKLVKVEIGGEKVEPENVEAGTGFYEKHWSREAIKPQYGEIKVTKEDEGVAWGGLHWQYFEDMTKITAHETNLKLRKTLFLKQNTAKGPVITPIAADTALSVGDLLTVRIELRADRDFEYVHMKDQRGSGLEPTEVLSQYRYQDGLGYYQSTKDTATHFFFDYLPKGTYVFEYTLRVQHRGTYKSGMAEIQCMYAPEFGSHSASSLIMVK